MDNIGVDITERAQALLEQEGHNPHATTQGETDKLEACKTIAGHGEVYTAVALMRQFHAFDLYEALQAHLQRFGKELTAESYKSAMDAILPHCTYTVSPQGQQMLWTLHVRYRREILSATIHKAEAAGQGPRSDMWASWPLQPNQSETMLKALLLGVTPALKDLDCDGLRTFLIVMGWVEGVVEARLLPPVEAVESAIHFQELIEPLRKITENFRGREQELKQLREYVDYLPSEGILEHASRRWNSLLRFFNLRKQPPLVISGVGGIGKSTLVGQFILNHWLSGHGRGENFSGAGSLKERGARHGLYFVYVDFERDRESLSDPLNLLVEVVRQISLQDLDRWDEWKTFYAKLKNHIEDSGHERKLRYQHQRYSQSVRSSNSEHEWWLQEFSERWNESSTSTAEGTLLVVLDSLEEVQQLGPEVVYALFAFMNRWADSGTYFRPVLVGRAEVEHEEVKEFKCRNLHLGEFDQASAIGYLMGRGITDEIVAKMIHERAGGNPLTLKLAVALYEKENAAHEGKWGVREWANFWGAFDKGKIQMLLFQRNLEHIQDKLVRKIAFPGMVVRRITPEVIQQVLAKPCGLGKVLKKDAVSMMHVLMKERFLVSGASVEFLHFRKELRRPLVELVRQKWPEQWKMINDLAVKYYERSSNAEDQAEYLYHRLLRGDAPRLIAPLVTSALWSNLITSLDELPVNAQVMLAEKFGMGISNDVLAQAEDRTWEQYKVQEVKKVLDFGQFEDLVRLRQELEARKRRSAESPLWLYQAIVHERLNFLEIAKEEMAIVMEFVERSLDKEFQYEAYLFQGKLLERQGEYVGAYDAMITASKVLKELPSDWKDLYSKHLDLISDLVRVLCRIKTTQTTDTLDQMFTYIESVLSQADDEKLSFNSLRGMDTLMESLLLPLWQIAGDTPRFTRIVSHLKKPISQAFKSLESEYVNQEHALAALVETRQIWWMLSDKSSKKLRLVRFFDQEEFERRFQLFKLLISSKAKLEQRVTHALKTRFQIVAGPGAFETQQYDVFLYLERHGKLDEFLMWTSG